VQVLLFAPHFAPEFEGGTEGVVRAQARELAARGHDVRIVTGSDRPWGGGEVVRDHVDGLEVAFLPRPPAEPYDLDLVRPRLAAQVAALLGSAELFHVHHWSTLHSGLVRQLAVHGPVVVTLHDLFTTCPLFFRLPPDPAVRCPEPGEYESCARCVAPFGPWSHEDLLAGFRRRASWIAEELAAASALVVPSRSLAERLAPFVGLDPARTTVVPHGLSRPLERVVTEPWNPSGPLRMLFLGHRSEVKGLLLAVRALAALPAPARARCELVLLGEALDPAHDERLRQEAGDLALTFAGAFEHAGLAERVRGLGPLHLGLFPSLAWESYGLVPDELWALGLPVWVGDRGAPQERVGAAGRILPVADAAASVPAWSRAFAEVLAQPELLEHERRAIPGASREAREAVLELEALYGRLVP
jgi:glycosyltransferase involved in cell wall biosynthesis